MTTLASRLPLAACGRGVDMRRVVIVGVYHDRDMPGMVYRAHARRC